MGMWREAEKVTLGNTITIRFLSAIPLALAAVLTVIILLIDNSAYAVGNPSELNDVVPKQVLILNPSNYGFPWQQSIDRAISDHFGANTKIKTELHIEYTGLSQNPDLAFEQKLLALYHHKYREKKPDLIISVSTNPLLFLLKHRENFFPDVPVVFLSSKTDIETDIENIGLRSDFTGLINTIDIKGTLDTVLKLHPKTQKIAIVSGDSKMDRFHEEKVWKLLENYKSRYDFIDLTSLPMAEIIEEVSRLPEHTIVLYVMTLIDSTGEIFVPREILPRIVQAANAPTYGFWGALLGGGIVGGHLASAEVIGTKLAEMGLDILKGETPENIPVVKGAHAYMFDWRQLERWGIQENTLPNDSIVLYKELSFWELYRWYISGLIILFLLETLLISFLFTQRSRLRHTEKELRASHDNLDLRVKERTDELIRANQNLHNEIAERIHAEEQRNELEGQLRQKHKMEAVGYMAGGMAHNFNNNLGIILGNVELSQMKQPHGSDVISLLENAKIAVRNSRDLILKIITYSRKGIHSKSPMQFSPIIDEAVALLRSTLPTTVSLQQNVSPDCSSVVVNVDSSQIQEILVNLSNNAVQAMNEEGDLTISLEPVKLEEKDIPAQYEATPGSYVKLSFQDTGCGMPAEMLDKVFDPFYTTKEDYEGAGMGLATVQGAVSQHGGLIKVNSIPNQGTVFNLYFPIAEEKSTVPKPINTDMPKGTEKILFVDDDEQLVKLGESLLSEMGYTVTIMTESTEALKLFTANPDHFDLVITDQTMPELCGKDLIQELKKISPEIPTILSTGYSSKIDEDKAMELGINAFLLKPLDLPKLLQTVRRVLDGEKK